MSLQRELPLIRHGWMRALFLLIVYIGVSVAAGFVIPTEDIWFTFNFVFSIALVFLFRKYLDRKSFNSIGISMKSFYPNSLIGLCLGIFLVSTGALLIYLLGGIEWIDIAFSAAALLYNIIMLLMISVAEELVFRGYALRNLMKSFNKWVALTISAFLFAAVHFTNPNVSIIGLINTFTGGLLLGITFIHTRNLWLPIFLHFSWNFIQGPLLGFPVSGHSFDSVFILQHKGNPLISGGNYGFEGSIVPAGLLAAAVLFWAYFEHKKSLPAYY